MKFGRPCFPLYLILSIARAQNDGPLRFYRTHETHQVESGKYQRLRTLIVHTKLYDFYTTSYKLGATRLDDLTPVVHEPPPREVVSRSAATLFLPRSFSRLIHIWKKGAVITVNTIIVLAGIETFAKEKKKNWFERKFRLSSSSIYLYTVRIYQKMKWLWKINPIVGNFFFSSCIKKGILEWGFRDSHALIEGRKHVMKRERS